MKIRNPVFILSASILLMGCLPNSPNSQFSSNRVAGGLSGGFRQNETLEVYSGTGLTQRRGRIERTGDFYNYGPARRNIEIIPVELPFSTDPDILLAPKRVQVLGGCSVDKVTDRTTCRLNVLPQGTGIDGGLYQTVTANGSILSACIVGHDFPGRTGAIRVDNNPAITTNTEGCISGSAARRLERQLINGSSLLTRRVEWPYDYSRDKEMLISGSFSTAQELYRWSASADLATLFSVR